MKIDLERCPIAEYFPDEMDNLEMFFSNGKKEFWRFDECKKLGIDSCVIFFPRHFDKLKNIYSKCKLVYEFKSASTVSPVYLYDNRVLIAMCPLGGPASANLMEELIYAGITKFIGTGSCGAITNINLDQFFIPVKAIRDEGVSYHYIKPSKYIETNKKACNAIEKVLRMNKDAYTKGIVWTTDAIYRETPMRIAKRLSDGACGVEMETASLAAVAKAKGVIYGCLLYYTDYNNGKSWETRFYDKYELREKVIKYAVDAVLSL